jgi:hypothetical protein
VSLDASAFLGSSTPHWVQAFVVQIVIATMGIRGHRHSAVV